MLEYIKQSNKIRKVLIAGSGAVGKTSLVSVLKEKKALLELAQSEKPLDYHRTPYLNLETIKTHADSDPTDDGVIQFFDVAGQLDLPIHAFRDTVRLTLGGVDLILLMFAGDSLQSLLDLKTWLDLLEGFYTQHAQYKFPDIVLLKNKSDLPSAECDSLVKVLLDNNTRVISYHEISCLTGGGVNEFQHWFIQYLFENKQPNFSLDEDNLARTNIATSIRNNS